MMTSRRDFMTLAIGLTVAGLAAGAAHAEEAEVIEARVGLALEELYRTAPGSQDLVAQAKGVLVMPKVVKGGFIVGGSYGEGALKLPASGGGLETVDYYSVAAASVGLQAGVQESSHALIFLTDRALAGFRQRDGWELGVDAEVTAIDAGTNVGLSSTEYRRPIVAIVFGEGGLLVGASLEGAKYSLIRR